jgi:pimeloyl-ACP methyl ester carboxylesterase
VSTPPFLELPDESSSYALSTPRGSFAVIDTTPAAEPRATAVLVPGFTGSKEDFIAVLAPLAAEGYRVVALDQRGQYETPGPPEADAYRVDELAADLHAVVRCLGDGPVHLVGHSFGGLVARAAVLIDQSLARSLTLMGSGPAAVTGVFAQRLALLEPVLADHGLDGLWHAIKALERADGTAVDHPARIADFLHHRFMSNTPACLSGMARALLDEPDRVDRLAASGLPLLVTYGEHDDVWSPSEQATMARRLGARDEPIPRAEHSPAAERPGPSAALMIDFWAQADRTAGSRKTTDA